MSIPSKKPRADLKVVLLGDTGVGKTCLVIRYTQSSFSQSEQLTIGASFFLKQRGPHNIAIWDTAGQERYKGLSSFYCRDAGAAVLCYDLSSKSSLEILKTRYVPLLNEERSCLKIIVGTKLDLVEPDAQGEALKAREVSREVGREYAKELNSEYLASHPGANVPYFETSSKMNRGVNELFDYTFQQCLGTLATDYSNAQTKSSTIKLHEAPSTAGQPFNAGQRKKCCSS